MSTTQTAKPSGGLLPRLFGVVLVLVGLVLAMGGLRLATLGGSWYYLIAGLLTVVSGVLLTKRNANGGLLYLVVVIGTAIWALAEVGTSFWGLVPRLAPVLVLGFLAALCVRVLSNKQNKLALPATATAAAAGSIPYSSLRTFANSCTSFTDRFTSSSANFLISAMVVNI